MGVKEYEINIWSNYSGTGASTFYTNCLEIIVNNTSTIYSNIVKLTTLDNYLSKNLFFESVDFLKIDVKGYEMNVLKGATNTICSKNVKFIQFEFGYFQIILVISFWIFWEVLSNDYDFYRIKINSVVKITEYNPDLEVFQATNSLCVLKSLSIKL